MTKQTSPLREMNQRTICHVNLKNLCVDEITAYELPVSDGSIWVSKTDDPTAGFAIGKQRYILIDLCHGHYSFSKFYAGLSLSQAIGEMVSDNNKRIKDLEAEIDSLIKRNQELNEAHKRLISKHITPS